MGKLGWFMSKTETTTSPPREGRPAGTEDVGPHALLTGAKTGWSCALCTVHELRMCFICLIMPLTTCLCVRACLSAHARARVCVVCMCVCVCECVGVWVCTRACVN